MKHCWLLLLLFIVVGCDRLGTDILPNLPLEPNPTQPVALLPVTATPLTELPEAGNSSASAAPLAELAKAVNSTTTPLIATSATPLPTAISSANFLTPSSATTSPTELPEVGNSASQPASPPSHVQRFHIGSFSQTDRDLIHHVVLRVDSAEVDPLANTLSFTVAFANQSNQRINLTVSRISDADWRLQDASGNWLQPLSISESLSYFMPTGGFAPAGATVGKITFPLPTGAQPYQLAFARSLDYTPLTISLDRPLSELPPFVPDGDYAIGVDLYSSQTVLAPLILRIEQVIISAETITFDLDFINNQRHGYTVRGIAGRDAWLLAADGQQLQPSAVSQSLETTITPNEGWAAYGSHQGQLVFPRPANLKSARFIFNGFSPLTLAFDEHGLHSTTITSATGGGAPPTPVPDAEEVALAAIDTLLNVQSEALLAGNNDLWASTFVPAVQARYADGLRRTGAMPLSSVDIRVINSAELNAQLSQGIIDDLPLQIKFEFAETVENPFFYSVNYDLTRTATGWLVTAIDFTETHPFWWDNDLVQSHSPHFQLFATSDAGDTLNEFSTEAEIAWQTLQAQGLPMDDRYLAYYTATQAEFSAQAGGSQQQLGIARSRYQIASGSLTISNRIFYINGESFADTQVAAANERQVTVTHELVHLVLGNLSRPFSPPWLTEGAAVFYSGDVSAEQRQRLLTNANYSQINLLALTAASSLGAHDLIGSRAAAEYAYSGELYNYLVTTYGEIATLNFYRSYNNFSGTTLQERIPSAATSAQLEAAMTAIAVDITPQLIETAFHISLAQLSADFHIWLEQ